MAIVVREVVKGPWMKGVINSCPRSSYPSSFTLNVGHRTMSYFISCDSRFKIKLHSGNKHNLPCTSVQSSIVRSKIHTSATTKGTVTFKNDTTEISEA